MVLLPQGDAVAGPVQRGTHPRIPGAIPGIPSCLTAMDRAMPPKAPGLTGPRARFSRASAEGPVRPVRHAC